MKIDIFGYNVNLVVIIVALLLGCIIGINLLCSCSKVYVKEGFKLIGAPIEWKLSVNVPGDTWANAPKSSDVNMYASLEKHQAGEVPLPEGKLDFLYNNKFDPSCCHKPQQYSSSSGCACLSSEQMKYLLARGGNNM
jgi:hypothetical protein